MWIAMEDYKIQGRSVILRSPGPRDAQRMIDYLQTVMGGNTLFIIRTG